MQKRAWLGGCLLMAAGLAFVLLGVLRGEHQTVRQKAILICMECIGLG